MEPLDLHPDRFFDPEPGLRRLARALYEGVKNLPLVCPHGHVDPRLLADDAPFPEPTSLLITPDHYIFRMLYSQGVALEDLGIPTRDGTPVETDPRTIWQRFANCYHLFAGTPTRAWLDYEFYHVFGLRERLTPESAMRLYDAMLERLQEPAFRPRALFEQFNIEVLSTTDAASDPLDHHRAIQASGWGGRVVPTFRPDAAFAIASPAWADEIARLEEVSEIAITSYADFLRVMEDRRAYFREMGAV
ncbi:MAG TPA: glucuronate isomerase, partial [Rhodothermales bacterium]|nr:glucuronate isomerase [Rhodothermales bacterium]